ncbi:hypothetical protein H7171_00445 [Candidatus Saccharibacteria bacterium]|nr:hypothetical protein [Candidatus Saccharibacteria bacterium]
MANKAQPQSDAEIDPELEKRVDGIMAPGAKKVVDTPLVDKLPDDDDAVITVRKIVVSADQPTEPAEPNLPQSSAPAVPDDLLQQIDAQDDSADTAIVVTKKSPQPVVIPVSSVASYQDEPLLPIVLPNAEPKPAIDKLYPTVFPKKETSGEKLLKPVASSPTRLDDAVTDAAIAAITASDSDELLAAEDAKTAIAPVVNKPSLLGRIFKRKLLWLLIIVLLSAVLAIPSTRNTVLGAVIKRSLTVVVMDGKTSKPVSAATVSVAGVSATTDASGKTVIKVPFGSRKLTITKQYYRASEANVTVGLGTLAPVVAAITATGRQVPITVVNSITGKPVADVELTVLKTSAKTDSKGKATIVLPTVGISTGGRVTATGYNDAAITVQITGDEVAGNTFSLTPVGRIYMLSNENGSVDVVKKNLDGSDKQTVLKGTGKEDAATTTLLVSRDWRFAVLRSQRDTPQPALYLIDTATDKVTTFDSGDTAFTTIGWIGHSFVYDAVRNSVPASQSGHEIVRSYGADKQQLNQIDQGLVDGDTTNYAYQGFYNFFIISDQLIYNTQWYVSGVKDIKDKTVAIRGAGDSGQNKKDYLQIPASGVGYIQAAQSGVRVISYAAYNYDVGKTSFYQFDGQTAATSASVTQATFNKTYPRYMISPSEKSALWDELRDGKSAVLSGSTSSSSAATPIAAFSGFTAYGWYGDNYVLLAKASVLYIAPADGSKAPVKVSGYYGVGQATGNGYGNTN